MSVVAAAVIGSAVVGGYVADKASGRAADAAKSATRSADAATQLGYAELDFSKQQYNDLKPYITQAAETAQDVSQAQLDSMRQQDELAQEYANYNREMFRPLERGIVEDASGYDTPEKRQAAANAAIADVNKGFASTREATMRRLAAEGVDPGSARAISILGDGAVEQATAQAGAAYKARQGVETQGFARKMDAASLGRNLPSNQATSAQIALQAGNNATGNAVTAVNAANAGTGVVQAGYQGAINAQQVAGNLYGQAANIQAQANAASDGLWGSLGTVGGALISKYSDENLKTDIEPVDEDEALEEIAATPVSTWKYDPAKLAQRGIEVPPEDEGTNTGPMAQDVAATMGPAASDGRRVNLVSMVGKTMAAVQGLDKKVNRLAAMLGSGQIQAGVA